MDFKQGRYYCAPDPLQRTQSVSSLSILKLPYSLSRGSIACRFFLHNFDYMGDLYLQSISVGWDLVWRVGTAGSGFC
jgi:hypothetical protein